MIALSKRLDTIKPSATIAISDKAAALAAAGKDMVSLSKGEPDFDTPEHIKEAAIKALRAGKTKYTAVDGTPELKDAVIEKFKRDNQLTFKREHIIVSTGAKQSIFNAVHALVSEGQEVIIPAPFWVSYPEIVRLAGGVPVTLYTDATTHYKITPAQLEKAITKKTVGFIINSPSNPTGSVYSRAELTALAQVLRQHPHIFIISDDIYEHILWAPEKYHTLLNVCPELAEQMVLVNGVSKAYAMTGFRIGYAASPVAITKAMSKLQSQSTSNACSISQAAAVAALAGDQSCIAPMVKIFKERHDFVVSRLNKIPGIACLPNQGTFYAFADASKAIQHLKLKDDIAFANYLLDVGVAVVPGTEFGCPGHIRLSYATSNELLQRGLDKIAKAVTDI